MNKEQVINQLRQQTVDILQSMLLSALEQTALELSRSGCGVDVANRLQAQRNLTCERFGRYLGHGFEKFLDKSARKIVTGDYPELSLVDDRFIKAANAMEGMVNYARNTHIELLINFNTRLGELLSGTTVDETNSPLDPDRIAQAFVDAIAPVEVDREFTLSVYRQFNDAVLRQLQGPLQRANEICIANGLLPELVVDGRSREAILGRRSSARPVSTPWERAFPLYGVDTSELPTAPTAELYNVIRELLHTTPASMHSGQQSTSRSMCGYEPEIVVPTSMLTGRQFNGSLFSESGMLPLHAGHDMQVAGRDVLLITRKHLVELLDKVQEGIITEINNRGEPAVDHRQFTRFLGSVLLESSEAGTINAIDGEVFDTLLIISLLFESFHRDMSLVKPVLELILATQTVIMKVALYDAGLFHQVNHPARMLLNEVASSGVGGLELSSLRDEPVYKKLEDLLIRLVLEYDGRNSLLDELLADLVRFKKDNRNSVKCSVVDSGSGECQKRIEEIHRYVHGRIQDRIREPLSPVVDELVNTHYHNFLVSVVQRDGQGSNSWILVVKILDLLLWTVNSEKKEGDFHRFQRVNNLLLSNLRKALLLAGLQPDYCDDLLSRLQEVQLASFQKHGDERQQQAGFQSVAGGPSDDSRLPAAGIPFSSPGTGVSAQSVSGTDCTGQRAQVTRSSLSQVDKLPVGSWLRFTMGEEQDLYCTLAARVQSMDKLVFVNSKGVSVVEKSRLGLALELQEGTAGIVSEWPLFERGLEAVIARLRDRRGFSLRH